MSASRIDAGQAVDLTAQPRGLLEILDRHGPRHQASQGCDFLVGIIHPGQTHEVADAMRLHGVLAKAMASTRTLFATRLYEASLAEAKDFASFNDELEDACRMLADEDQAGQAWCRQKGYGGYTSYASLDDLPSRATIFGELKKRLDRHAAAFADALAFDLGAKGKLRLDSLWVNILDPRAAHSGHVHPHSVLSGTVYVATPKGSGGLRLEDPRLPMMMAAPPRRSDAPEALQTFVTLKPAPGTLYLWESWLRHEVEPNAGRGHRISISFNYGWR